MRGLFAGVGLGLMLIFGVSGCSPVGDGAQVKAGVVGSYPNMLCCWHPPVAGVPTRTPDPNFRGGWRAASLSRPQAISRAQMDQLDLSRSE